MELFKVDDMQNMMVYSVFCIRRSIMITFNLRLLRILSSFESACIISRGSHSHYPCFVGGGKIASKCGALFQL